MTYRALLLDAVGTTIALREPAERVYARVAGRHGIAVDPEAVGARMRQAIGSGPPSLEGVAPPARPDVEREHWRGIVRTALGPGAADGPCFEELFALYATAELWAPVPGAQGALARVRRAGGLTCVVSNMDSRLPGLLELLGLGHHFDDVVIPAVCGFAKPDPRIFHFALERLGVAAGEALYVGDRERDCVASARAAGLAALRYDPAGDPDDAEVLTDWLRLPDPA